MPLDAWIALSILGHTLNYWIDDLINFDIKSNIICKIIRYSNICQKYLTLVQLKDLKVWANVQAHTVMCFRDLMWQDHLLDDVNLKKTSIRAKKKNSSFNFEEWLVGFTDGDGTFNIYINPEGTKVTFTYKLSQSKYNIKLLYLIKSKLGIGTINLKDGPNEAAYMIRNQNHLLNNLIPIFDKYPLLTSKRFSYLVWKEGLLISNKEGLTQKQKIDLIKEIYRKPTPKDYVSDAWDSFSINKFEENRLEYVNELNSIMSKSWLTGFIEAEGSFYYVRKDKDKNRIVHAFGITQKLDIIVLYAIKSLLHVSSSIKIKKNFNMIETTNSRNIEYIVSYFQYNDATPYFLGIKSFEFKIWVRTYFKYKGDSVKLEKIRNWINRLRNKHKI